MRFMQCKRAEDGVRKLMDLKSELKEVTEDHIPSYQEKLDEKERKCKILSAQIEQVEEKLESLDKKGNGKRKRGAREETRRRRTKSRR